MTDDVHGVTMHYQQVARLAAAVLGDLTEIESAIGELEARINDLPLFARGFVASQVARGTGQDIPTWSKTITALTSALRQAREAAARGDATVPSAGDIALYVTARERVDQDRPRLEKLAAFMESVPSKLGAVPPGLLPPDQRAEFLDAIAHQTQALRSALAQIPALSTALAGLSGEW